MKIISWGWSRITEKNSLQITLYQTVLEMQTIVIIIIIVVIIVAGNNIAAHKDIRWCLLDVVSNIIEIFLRMTSFVNPKVLKLLQIDDVWHDRCYGVTERIVGQVKFP